MRKGSSIYEVHTDGGGVRLRLTHAVRGSDTCGRPHRICEVLFQN